MDAYALDEDDDELQQSAPIGRKLSSLKDIRSHGSFTGNDADFENFIFALEAETTEMGWGELMEAARDAPTAIDNNAMSVDASLIRRNLYTFWSMKAKGKAVPSRPLRWAPPSPARVPCAVSCVCVVCAIYRSIAYRGIAKESRTSDPCMDPCYADT